MIMSTDVTLNDKRGRSGRRNKVSVEGNERRLTVNHFFIVFQTLFHHQQKHLEIRSIECREE